ncbi:histone-lysine N-methyltransferase, H3 lysine-79 specific-like [Ruditapes philippinarum]|uniref:histone-lysine N-methyltransferase, H3 lysine-79 specific-like n=1 Tax=Ruditapes philippinarum TaxID=129788 RepID=UPI00295C1DC3|nr:histone-lysine N-methyltransferase, H3 lysine-79 specific-like [Ruditapes philippinarum]
MDSDGWLSTKNKKKLQRPQPRLKKTRSSTLKPPKSSLQITHSPPPKELFTSTKQSSLIDFFSANSEPQMEVEVIFDHDSQTQKLNASTKSNDCLGRSSSQSVKEDLQEDRRENSRNKSTDSIPVDEEQENLYNNMTVTVDSKTKVQIEDEKEFSPTGKESENSVSPNCHEMVTNVADTTIRLDSKDLNARRPLKRIKCYEDTNVDADNPLKRARLDVCVMGNDDKLSNTNCEISVNVVNNSNKSNREVLSNMDHSVTYVSNNQKTIDMELEMGNGSDAIDSNLQFSCSNSQSLDLGSPLALNSQDVELSTLDAADLEIPNDVLSNTVQNEDIHECSLTFTCETENIDNLTKDGEDSNVIVDMFTLADSQNIMSVKNFDKSDNTIKPGGDESLNTDSVTLTDSQDDTLVCTGDNITSEDSLDLTNEGHLFDIGANSKNTVDLPESSKDDSQLTFSSSSPESLSEYQSLDFS